MIHIAIRQMLSKKKQTSLIFLGIAFGTMVYVIIAGIQFGFRKYLTEQLLNNTAHIIIKGSDRYVEPELVRSQFFNSEQFVRWYQKPSGKRDEAKLENPSAWFDILQKDPNVLTYSPKLTINAIASRGSAHKNIILSGIIPKRQIRVSSLEDYMRQGSLLDLSGGGNKIILGSNILKTLGTQLGESINISIGVGDSRPFRIVGNLHMGNEHFDDSLAYANLQDTQSLNKTPGRISEISVALIDMTLSIPLAKQWSKYTKDTVQGWEEANAQFMQMIKIQDVVRMIMTTAILLVASFGIYNVLTIMINQKQKEIAILRSIGYGPDKILLLFLVQGFMLGLLGGALGLVFGFVVLKTLGSIDLGFDIGKSRNLLISYDLSIFVTAILAAQVAAAIASFLPARAASRLTPLDIIRSNI